MSEAIRVVIEVGKHRVELQRDVENWDDIEVPRALADAFGALGWWSNIGLEGIVHEFTRVAPAEYCDNEYGILAIASKAWTAGLDFGDAIKMEIDVDKLTAYVATRKRLEVEEALRDLRAAVARLDGRVTLVNDASR